MGRTDETQYVTEEFISELEAEMMEAAEQLEFEKAAAFRDRVEDLKAQWGVGTHREDGNDQGS